MNEVGFELLDALDGFCRFERRSATLEGSVPLKAAQFCTPFIAGNAAGFHVLFADDSVEMQRRRRECTLLLDDAIVPKISVDYPDKIEKLVERGILAPDSLWLKKLRKSFAWRTGDTMNVWTGHLLRAQPGLWLLVSGAFNRHSALPVEEYVIAGGDGWVPLIVRLDVSGLSTRGLSLAKEIACVLPLRPDVKFSRGSLRDNPAPGHAYNQHQDERFDDPRPGQYSGAYRKLVAHEPADDEGAGDCQLVVSAGKDLHRVRTFERFATPMGWSASHRDQERLEYLVVRGICPVTGRWDGESLSGLTSAHAPATVSEFRDTWRDLYGEDQVHRMERFIGRYALYTHGPRIGEALLALVPWLFVVTPPGWSSVVDGWHSEDLDGMRGVISTDVYHNLFMVWQFKRHCRLALERGQPLMRVLPVPRRLLKIDFREERLQA